MSEATDAVITIGLSLGTVFVDLAIPAKLTSVTVKSIDCSPNVWLVLMAWVQCSAFCCPFNDIVFVVVSICCNFPIVISDHYFTIKWVVNGCVSLWGRKKP